MNFAITDSSKEEELKDQIRLLKAENQTLKNSLKNYQDKLESALKENKRKQTEWQEKQQNELQRKKYELDLKNKDWKEQERSRLKDEVTAAVGKDFEERLSKLQKKQEQLAEWEENLEKAERYIKPRTAVCLMGKIVDGVINVFIDFLVMILAIIPIGIILFFALWAGLFLYGYFGIAQFIVACVGLVLVAVLLTILYMKWTFDFWASCFNPCHVFGGERS